MAKDFWVDTSDPPYPTIRHVSHQRFDPDCNRVLSLTQARREIKVLCRYHRDHWLSVLKHQTEQSSEVITQEAVESRRLE